MALQNAENGVVWADRGHSRWDGVRYRLHANHLRIFFIRVDEVNIDGYGNEYYTIVIIFNALPLCFQF